MVLCLPPVVCCHSLCRTFSPPLWTVNRSLGLTVHLKKIRSFTLLTKGEPFYYFFTLLSFVFQKELSGSKTSYLDSTDALWETTDLRVFLQQSEVTFPTAFSTQRSQNRKAGAADEEQSLWKLALFTRSNGRNKSTNLLQTDLFYSHKISALFKCLSLRDKKDETSCEPNLNPWYC